MIYKIIWHDGCFESLASQGCLFNDFPGDTVMMKKTIFGTTLFGCMFAMSAHAATLTNWYIDTDGAGGNAPELVIDYLDLVGQAYVKNTFTSATTFTFNEVGRFTTATADGGSGLGGNDLSPSLLSYFVGTGSGTTGGILNFNPGATLDVFSGATGIADFVLLEGSANLIANSTLPNGTVSLIFRSTSMATGYFFDEFMNDLAPIANSVDGLVLGFATTNAISLANGSATVTPTLIGDYNAAFDPDVVGPIVANDTTDLYLSNNGQFRVAVPEPGLLGLLGIGLLGMGLTARKRKV